MHPSDPMPFRQLHYSPPDRCSEDALIIMSDIVKTFKTAEGEFTALKSVTTCFYPGEFVSIVGKSGSGKSTLVNMLTGIDHPTAGSVRVGDTIIHKLNENEMSRWRGRNLGIVFQFFQLMPTLTLLENIMLPMALCGSCGPVDREKRSLDLLRLVGLDNMANKLPAAVSGGQQQSVAIARALANDPPILIADEPTGNLDSRSADEVFEIFNGLVEQGKTILMVTHDPTLAQRTHRTLLLSDGELINPWVAQAFAELSHSQMLWLTHHMQPQTISPGAPAIPTGTLPPGVCLVTGGQMEVAIKHKPRGESTLKLQPGEYLTAYQPSANGNGAHTLRASLDKPAELLTLELATLREWLKANPEAEAVLQAGSSRFESFEGVAQ
jgi:putative ABC transport system ATP-binding protein